MTEDPPESVAFDCQDCGVSVVRWFEGPTLCAECQWISELPLADQPGARRWLRRLHAETDYRNESYAERACDRCGGLYHGPAVYCSLACAVADA